MPISLSSPVLISVIQREILLDLTGASECSTVALSNKCRFWCHFSEAVQYVEITMYRASLNIYGTVYDGQVCYFHNLLQNSLVLRIAIFGSTDLMLHGLRLSMLTTWASTRQV